MAYPQSFDRYHKNWQMIFEHSKYANSDKLEKPAEIIEWKEWKPAPITQNWDFESQKNRKIFFIINEKPLEIGYIIV